MSVGKKSRQVPYVMLNEAKHLGWWECPLPQMLRRGVYPELCRRAPQHDISPTLKGGLSSPNRSGRTQIPGLSLSKSSQSTACPLVSIRHGVYPEQSSRAPTRPTASGQREDPVPLTDLGELLAVPAKDSAVAQGHHVLLTVEVPPPPVAKAGRLNHLLQLLRIHPSF